MLDESNTLEVSVIVITYNQNIDKLTKTLDSIIAQELISYEIIVCDDGSDNPPKTQIESYFISKNFSGYTLCFHEKNRGTVLNYYSGLLLAKGKYSKLISPGDYFSENTILSRWVKFMEKNEAEWSFSDTYYYRNENGIGTFFKAKAHPQITHPYIEMDKSRCMWNYVSYNDIANGAAILGKTYIQMQFCKIITEGNVKYTEDSIYSLMSLQGIVGYYFPEAAICYEYGTGVSASRNRMWQEKLIKDRNRLIQIMLDEKDIPNQHKKMVDSFITINKKNKFRKLFVKGYLFYWIKYHFHPRLTKIPEQNETIYIIVPNTQRQ